MILFAALMVFDLLFLWAVSISPGWWSAKIALAVIAVVLNFGVMHAFNSGDGWPTAGFPSGPALYLNCYAITPEPPSTSGAIYLLVVPRPTRLPIGYMSRDGSPRLFVEPYDQTLYQECLAANKAVQRGVSLMIRRQGGTKGNHNHSGSSLAGKFHIYRLPPPHPTPKPTGQHGP